MTRAVISLGTNTTRLLVVRDGPGDTIEILEQGQTGTRLGEGLRDGGTLLPAAVERTLDAVRAFTARARAHDATPSSIATSALRRAENAGAFAAKMLEITGAPLEIVSGRVEAAASYRGATYGTNLGALRVAVVDVGGGSTEVAVGTGGRLEDAHSIEIGSVRLAERHPDVTGATPGKRARAAAAAARADAAALVRPFAAFAGPDQARAVAGTALTIAAVALACDVTRASGRTISLATIDETVDMLLGLELEARRALPGMLPQRADILPAGAIVLAETLRALGAERVLLEENDLLLGFLLMQRERSPHPAG